MEARSANANIVGRCAGFIRRFAQAAHHCYASLARECAGREAGALAAADSASVGYSSDAHGCRGFVRRRPWEAREGT